MYGPAATGEVRYQPKGVIGNIVRMYMTSSGSILLTRNSLE
jgi:hypothetical protein